MATKKKGPLEIELEKADYMSIISGGGTCKAFSTNTLVDYSYSTGISIIDYAFAYEVIVKDENGNFIKKRLCRGLQAGSFNVLTGRTQSYKTTLACQMAANIAFKNNGNIVHYDAEQRIVLQRVKTLTKLPDSWFAGETPIYSLKSGAIGFDTLQNDITEIYENKLRNKDILLRDTGEVDHMNKPIKLMPPTIIFIDSIQGITQKEYNVTDKKLVDDLKELRGNMYGAQSAKTMRGFMTDILPMLNEANIIVLAIAHKTANMSVTPFAGVKKQFQYGNNDERISGGSSIEFNPSAVINLTGLVKEESRYHMDTDGFEGNTVLFEPTKSSTNESGNEKTGLGFLLVIDKRKEGIDNIRTLVKFLGQRNRLKGNKAGYRVLDKNGEVISEKFTWKKIYEDFNNDPKTYKTFMLAAKEELESLVAPAEDVAGSIKPFDIDQILNEIQ